MELGPNQIKWLEALRSGDYDQCAHFLKLMPGENDSNDKPYNGNHTLYCCLGVACDVFNLKESQNHVLTRNYKKLGLREEDGLFNRSAFIGVRTYDSLVEMNDHGMTFAEIADYIEANPENVFEESK